MKMYYVKVTNKGIITEYCIPYKEAMEIQTIWQLCDDVTVEIEEMDIL